MSQSSQIGAVPDGTGQEVLDNFNEVDAAVASMSAGNSAPTNPVVAQWWWDLDDGIIKRRNTANTAWEFIENVGATTPPGVTDDSAAGYVIGSRWLDTSGLSVWVLEDPAAGAAVWVQVGSGSGSGDMLASVYDPQAIGGDAFDTDNHTSGTSNKVYTAAEQTKLATLGTILSPTAAIASSYPAGETVQSLTFTGVAVGDAVLAILPPAGVVTEQIYCYGGKVTGADTIDFVVVTQDSPSGISGLSGNFTAVVMDLTP